MHCINLNENQLKDLKEAKGIIKKSLKQWDWI
jgi:hypothetical protein